MNELNRVILSSLGWKFLERIGSQLASFVLGVILARLLTPTEYGTVALVTIFISLATVFVQGGFNTALIQQKEDHLEDYSTILLFSLGVAGFLYILLYLCAPLIADFYHNAVLVKVVRVLSLTLIPGAFNSVQVAYVTKRMQFHKLFVSNTIGVITSGLLGIILAMNGAGVWAIVAQQLGTQLIICVVLMFISDWRPQCVFSLETVRTMVPFGSKILASNLLIALFLDIRSLIIGRIYSAEDLAFFNRGRTFPSAAMDAVNGTLQSVMLPIYSNMQDNREALLSALRKSVRLSCYLIFPCLLGLAAVGEPLVVLFLTEKWNATILFLQVFALGYMTHPIQITTAQALKAIGRSDITLRIEIYRKVSEVICLLVAIPFGVKAIAVSTVVASVIACMLGAPSNKRALGYTYRQQIFDFLPPAVYSTIMFIVVRTMLQVLNVSSILRLVVGTLVGVGLYLLESTIMKDSSFYYILAMIRRKERKIDHGKE